MGQPDVSGEGVKCPVGLTYLEFIWKLSHLGYTKAMKYLLACCFEDFPICWTKKVQSLEGFYFLGNGGVGSCSIFFN